MYILYFLEAEDDWSKAREDQILKVSSSKLISEDGWQIIYPDVRENPWNQNMAGIGYRMVIDANFATDNNLTSGLAGHYWWYTHTRNDISRIWKQRADCYVNSHDLGIGPQINLMGRGCNYMVEINGRHRSKRGCTLAWGVSVLQASF